MTTASGAARSDPDRTARSITGKSDRAVNAPTTELRQGVVTAVNVAAARLDLALGGDTTAIPGVAHLSNYRPTVNDTCWVLVNGPDLLVLDRAATLGPSVISTATIDVVDTEEGTSSSSYGDLATFGPQVTVSVSPSGLLLVGVSASIVMTGEGGGGGIATVRIDGPGGSFVSPYDGYGISLYQNAGTAGSELGHITGNTTLFVNQSPGVNTVTMKYRAIFSGDLTDFRVRNLWALPL